MTALEYVVIALAGGLGAACRLLLDGIVRARTRGSMPWGTITINLTGSLLLGAVVGAGASAALPPEAVLVVGTGFIGGYTTFSTASFEVVRLLQERKPLLGVLHAGGSLVAATALAAVGLWLGSLL